MMNHNGQKSLFYANFSVTDKTAAPKEWNLAFLCTLAPGINDRIREEYFDKIIDRFETLTQQSVKNNIIFKQSFCKMIFVEYNSYKGNYGMANTL
jgi:phytoene desaturase